eukprot:14764843-Ditylum_brightwellii.AAC.1
MEAEGVSPNDGQVASKCSKVGVDQDSSRPSLSGMVVKGVLSASSKQVDCEVDSNEGHTRSNVKSPGTEESAPTSRLTSEGGSNAEASTEEKEPFRELAMDIVKVQVGGSNAAAAMEEKAPFGELATNIVKAEGGGSNTVATKEEKAPSEDLATNIVKIQVGGFNAVTSTEGKAPLGS